MLLKLSRFFVYTAVFSVVVVLARTFFPFIGGKYYFFRICVELGIIFFALWWGFEASAGEVKKLFKPLLKNPLFILVSVFAIVFVLAALFADDPKVAFWSNYERGEGGFQMLHYYAFFLLLVLLFRDEQKWKTLFVYSLVAAALMIGYGLIAQLGSTGSITFISPYGADPPPTFWGKLASARFQGSLGNPAYVAPYLMFAIFFALYLWLAPLTKKIWSWRGVGYIALALSFLFFFVLSQTRGALLGLGASLILYFLILALSRQNFRKPALLGLAIVLVAGGLLIANRNSGFVRALPGSRIFNISFGEQTVKTRLWTWGSAWRGFKDRPILGWGPENFSTVFDKHFDIRHYIPGQNSETWFDRAHGVLFDYLAETGILGLLAYIGIFAAFAWEFFKNGLSNGRSPAAAALFPAILGGYLVQGLVLFDVLPIYLNIFIVLAMSVYIFSHESR